MYTTNCTSAGAFNILCITTDAGQVNPTKRPTKQARLLLNLEFIFLIIMSLNEFINFRIYQIN
jgi:hypothetical protein